MHDHVSQIIQHPADKFLDAMGWTRHIDGLEKSIMMAWLPLREALQLGPPLITVKCCEW
jgi:hypothetical protein